jgi:hypothetical protein
MVERVIVSRFDFGEKCLRFTDTRCTSRAIDGVLTVVYTFCMGLFGFGSYGTCVL